VRRARFDRLLKLVDAGLIRVLDLEFVTNADGVARTVPASQAGPEFSLFEGAASGLLDRDDLDGSLPGWPRARRPRSWSMRSCPSSG
jgi:hypothetical protein